MAHIWIIGLGTGGPEGLTGEAFRRIANAGTVYVDAPQHPALGAATGQVVHLGNLDAPLLASHLVDLSQVIGDVVFATPGNPAIDFAAMSTVLQAASLTPAIAVSIIPGLSYLDAAAMALRLDPLEAQLQFVDARQVVEAARAEDLNSEDRFRGVYRVLDPTQPALVARLRRAGSALPPALASLYPPEHRATLVRFGSAPSPQLEEYPVAGLASAPEGTEFDCLFLPAADRLSDLPSFDTLRFIVARLRAPNGCPWDREQSYQTIKKHLIEETYEAVAALDDNDLTKFAGELGDVLLQVVMYSQLGREAGDFRLEDVLAAVNAKLIRRHPHVFGGLEVSGSAEVLRNWERIKRSEAGAQETSFGGVPEAAPALVRADAVLSRAARYGWPGTVTGDSPSPTAASRAERLNILGDTLLRLVEVARHEQIDAEEALRLATNRFRDILERALAQCRAEGIAFDNLADAERRRRLRAAAIDS